MGLLTKKILSALFLPVPLTLFFLLLGLFILFFSKRNNFGLLFIFLGTFLLLVFSTPFLPNAMIWHLESQYPPLKTLPSGIKNILVLGSGNGGYPYYPANDKLSAASLARLIEGIRLHKQMPNGFLILSGGRVFGSPPDSDAMNNVASMLGTLPSHIKIEKGSQDTFEEAINIKKLLGTQPFILVTSGYHMPRAIGLYRKQGMDPIPAPTELLSGSKRFTIKRYFPNASNLQYSDLAIHEYLGILWSKLQGRI